MTPAPLTADEPQRLAELAEYQVLDTEPELGCDDITALAASICNTPIALISLIDTHRQWFKSHHGLTATETSRDLAFCAHAILQRDVFVVPDATLDPRFYDNPLTTHPPHVRFYAGAPLITPAGHTLGTLCVIDHVPRTLTASQLSDLKRLARQAMCQLELRRTRDEAQAATQAKSEFLATMTHEIRTPLNGVLGVSQLLNETSLSHEQQELVGIVQRSGQHLLMVVNDILDFSKLEAKHVHLEAMDFDLREVIDDVIALNADSAQQKGLLLKLDWQCTESRRIGDPHRLRQALLNLVGNAIKFTQHGSVTLEVIDDAASDKVQIGISDTGIGIAPSAQRKLFNRFTQVDSSITRQYGGTGLGLAIVRQIVELMGGTWGVTSEVNMGSRFWLTIPLPIADTPQTLATADVVPSDYCNLSGRSVLLAEDDEVNQLLTARLLQKHNCHLTIVTNGAAAVQLCSQRKFDIILMDGMMPELDGYQATMQIRALPNTWCKFVPIIALTANALNGDKQRSFAAGMSDHVSKPISRQSLDNALRKAIGVH